VSHHRSRSCSGVALVKSKETLFHSYDTNHWLKISQSDDDAYVFSAISLYSTDLVYVLIRDSLLSLASSASSNHAAAAASIHRFLMNGEIATSQFNASYQATPHKYKAAQSV
jgi:hypothetical protein